MNENLRLKQVYADAGFEFSGIDPQYAGSALFEKKVGKEMLTQTLQHTTLIAAPAGYAWRPYRREDVPALYQMLLAADRADERQSNMTLEDMQRQFDDPWSNPETDSPGALLPTKETAANPKTAGAPLGTKVRWANPKTDSPGSRFLTREPEAPAAAAGTTGAPPVRVPPTLIPPARAALPAVGARGCAGSGLRS